MRGSGADIWDNADEFRFVHRGWSGDGDFVTRVASLQNTHGWAKAGIMFRDGLGPGAPNVFLAINPGGAVQFQQRSASGGATTAVQGAWTYPTWLKVTRRGNVFTAYTSQSGSSWTELGSTTLALPPSVLIGLAVTSHNDGVLCTATFDPVVPPQAGPPDTLAAPSNLSAIGGQGRATLTWTDNATNESRFALYGSQLYHTSDPPPEDASGFLLVSGSIPANTTSYVDTSGGVGWVRYYAVRAIKDSAVPSDPPLVSSFSNLATATLPFAWSGFDIGTPGVAGRSSDDRQVYTVAGAGADIGGIADGGRFYGISGSDDIDLRARVASVANTDPQAKAGIMFRPDTAGAGEANAFVYAMPNGTVGFQVRRAPNDATTTVATATAPVPVFLRLERVGDTFTGYYSSDGSAWTALGSAYANVPRWQEVGFAVTSRQPGTLCEARFDRLTSFGAWLIYPVEWPRPSIPANPAATGLAPDEIQLAWSLQRGVELGCEIQRSTDGVNFTRRVTVFNHDGRGRFVDRNVTPGTRYYYRFRSYNPAGYSALSAVVSALPPASVVGLADPGRLSATPGNGVINLSWSDHSSYETGYEIERATDGATFTRLTVAPASSGSGGLPSFSDNSVASGVTYQYRLRARDGTRVSAYSNVAQATAPGGDPGPAAPTNLTARAPASNRIELGWQDNATNETGYTVERSVGFSGEFTPLVSLAANATGYVDTGVTAGTWYSYRVYARNAAGASGHSNHASVQVPTSAPATPVWESRDVGAVAAAGNDSEAGGQVTISASGADIWGTADEFRYRYMTLTGNGEIVARVTSLGNTNGWAKAGVMFRESLQSGAPHAFMCISATQGTALQRRLSSSGASFSTTGVPTSSFPRWVRLVRNGSTFLGYDSADGVTWTLVDSVSISLLETAHVGLAVTSHQDGTLTTATFDQVVVRTVTGGTLPAPTGLTATATAHDRVNLTWTDNATSEAGFEVQMAPNPTAFSAVATTAANATSHPVTGLWGGSTYYFRVRAIDAAGSSAFSNVASVTTPPAPPPSSLGAPSNLSVTGTTASTVNLAWTDNATSELGFEVGISTDNVNFDWSGRTFANTTTAEVAGLRAGTMYYFQVRAYQDGGTNYLYSAPSNTASATTSSGSTPPPVGETWVSADIGAVAAAGRTEGAGSAVQLTGSGADVWNTADEFRYHYRPFTGDGTIVARVTTLSNTHGWAKAGVMFRESLDPDARHAAMIVSIAHGTALQYRSVRGGESGSTAPTESGGVPRWLRLVRSGNTFTGAQSVDGVNWTPAGSITLDLPSAIYVGLSVTSHNDGVLCMAAFEGVALNGSSSPPPPPTTVAAPTNLAASAGSNGYGRLEWLDNANNETGYQVERSTNGSTFVEYASIPANSTSYADFQGQAGATYWYRVRATAGSVVSGYSNTVSFTVASGPAPVPTWSFTDVGAVSIAGSNTSSGNTITIRGAGDDIWGGADEFRFVYRALAGDGFVEAQVTSQQYTHGWAKAGVMIRETLDANARNAFAFVTPVQHGVSAQARTVPGSETTSVAGPPRNAPYWVRVTRQGTTFTAAASPDGVAWTTYATFTIPMGSTAYFGFAVTSHDDTQLGTAVFADPFVGTGTR